MHFSRAAGPAWGGPRAAQKLVQELVGVFIVERTHGKQQPVGTAALSPVTDLTLSGESDKTRAEAQPYFVRSQAEFQAGEYLNGAEPTDHSGSPLFEELAGLPPIRMHVEEDEVLLDDSRRYVAKAVHAETDAGLDIWEGVAHGFLGSVGELNAADQALAASGPSCESALATDRVL